MYHVYTICPISKACIEAKELSLYGSCAMGPSGCMYTSSNTTFKIWKRSSKYAHSNVWFGITIVHTPILKRDLLDSCLSSCGTLDSC